MERNRCRFYVEWTVYMLIHELVAKNKIHPPSFLEDNTHYLVVMGSQSYGCAVEGSDWDIYGWAIPPKEHIFPHLAGCIAGFGTQIHPFNVWQEHHVRSAGKEYDFHIYSIVHYFQLVMQNNPNMIDSLFVPQNCVLHSSHLGEMVRDNRKLFLHKGAWYPFKGYAYSRLTSIKNPQDKSGNRKESVEKFGYDVKDASHCVRLLNEIEQILTEGDLDLQRNKEQLRSIRRGEWSLEQVEAYFERKRLDLETVYAESKLPATYDEQVIKAFLLQVLEEHFGSLDKAIAKDGSEKLAMMQIMEIIKPFVR